MNIRIIIIFAVLASAVYFGYEHFFGAAPAGGPQGGAAAVSVAEVISKDVIVWSDFSGRLEAVDHVEIRPQVSGNITAVLFDEGARVKKGQKLFTIDPRPFEAALNQAEANLIAAGTTLDLAKLNQKRAEELVKTRALAQSELDKRTNDTKVAEGNLQAAKAALVTAKLNVEYANITAPVSGRISRAEITLGNYVSSSPTPPLLTTIVSESPIYIDFEVDEHTFLKYISKPGADTSSVPVEFAVGDETGTPHHATVKSFDNELNTSSGTVRVRAVTDNKDGSLLPGVFARVRIGSASTENVTLINEAAVGTDQSKKFVWVVGDDNKAAWREIHLGEAADGLRIVTDGLKAGEKIVVNGQSRIMRPDTPVTPELVNMDGSKLEGDKAPEATPEADKPAEEKPADAAPAPDAAAPDAPVADAPKDDGDKKDDTSEPSKQ